MFREFINNTLMNILNWKWPLPLTILSTSFCLVFSTLTALPQPQQQNSENQLTTSELAEKLQPSMLTIRQLDRRGKEHGVGSGFFISTEGHVVTNLHVIGEGRPVKVTDKSGREYIVTAIHAWNRMHDLAILKVNTGDSPVLPIPLASKNQDLEKGQSIIALGNPQGLENSIVEGVVSEMRSFDKTSMYQIAIPIEPGNSGGPIVDRLGIAHGVVSLKSVVTDNLGFAVHSHHIHQLLDSPNTVTMENWVRLGEPNPKFWTNKFGANWKIRHGSISVSDMGDSFGGRSLLLRNSPLTELPYEIRVSVKMNDESGAAGLVFGADGKDAHWGFYPSSGNLRLTHFQGPDVFSWDIVAQINSRFYKPGDWNALRILVSESNIKASLNGESLISHPTPAPVTGLPGLAKFRQTSAQFKNFKILKASQFPSPEFTTSILKELDSIHDTSSQEWKSSFLKSELASTNPDSTTTVLLNEIERLKRKTASLEQIAQKLHHTSVQGKILSLVNAPSFDTSVSEAALSLGLYENPDLDISSYLQILDEMAEEILVSLPDFATQEQRVDALIDYLYKKNGFRGSRSDYQNTANSFLSKVIDDREGLPISLSIIVMEIGKRLFIDGMSGAALPGHFMVAWTKNDGKTLWIDAFNEGKILNAHQVAESILGSSSLENQVIQYANYSAQETLLRMTRNLINFSENPDNLKFLDLLVALAPEDHTSRFQRAFEYIQARDPDSAKPDLDYLIQKNPPEINIRRLKDFYNSIYP